jgi:hypothetical protein
MKPPEWIKKGLEQCANTETCENCGYRDECRDLCSNKPMTKDSLAYIQQLEHERDSLLKELSYNCGKCKHIKCDARSEPCVSCKVLYDSREQLSVKSNFEWEGAGEEE